MLTLRPITVRQAVPFVARVHRRLPRVQGAMWAVSVWADAQLVGVAVVGHPARELMADTLAVLRVAVLEGYPNACSMLYGACARAARAMGAANLVTYTHADESGVSLKAAGWLDGGTTDGGAWGRESRERALPIDGFAKRRWWAAWSRRGYDRSGHTEAGTAARGRSETRRRRLGVGAARRLRQDHQSRGETGRDDLRARARLAPPED